MKLKLSRKRKKKYKSDLTDAFYKHYQKMMIMEAIKGNSDGVFSCLLLLMISRKKVSKMQFPLKNSVEEWEWFYFRRRVEVNSMFTILGCTEYGEINKITGKWVTYETPIEKHIDNDILLSWYKKHYPDDKLAHHYCKQNRMKHR